MYAIVETGGKQYKVSPNQLIRVEDLGKNKGEIVEMDKVLFYADNGNYRVGRPYIENAKVIAHVTERDKGKKILIFKYKPKKGYRRRMGHRQQYTQLLIKEIKV
ncbi:50S ribosomal protein L21 [Candidatus Desantisbacteria bacterium CG07_land_8_20_14_0_80_39_15]|uniref:Large ribosomal subunit protein bL21 n=2 Tax=unclassified Candidatus Desantisiibacteriota TaxID=3106372 RepID=A0A2H9PBC4_9BACT|nr:MAG: 50S ribosomal protein L21 [Candidatus Desantisbacteria bacterium CG07_land_8_20_14_0_80_39_15]PIZ16014.1 MAG: 50S ribosomal protein L21 [Candidatus Desantisbacteria bacterium CG_4_10_14_0_8_um_filter_39_17]